MKLGLISDIHGHINALTTALKLLADLGAEQILCLGDMVQPDTDSIPVLNIIRHNDILTVFGNHEQDVINQQSMQPTLDEDTLTFLTDLPFSRTVSLEGKIIYMTHASPWDESRGLYFRHPQSYQRAAAQTKADIVLVGHTHAAGHVQFDKTHFYNPGAVWDSNSGRIGTCALLTLPDQLFEVFSLASGERLSFSLVVD